VEVIRPNSGIDGGGGGESGEDATNLTTQNKK
jgi:hypothetical protein